VKDLVVAFCHSGDRGHFTSFPGDDARRLDSSLMELEASKSPVAIRLAPGARSIVLRQVD